MSKIRIMIEDYDFYIKQNIDNLDDELIFNSIVNKSNELILNIKKMKLKNIITINRLIETALEFEKNHNKNVTTKNNNKYTRKILNVLYKANKELFLLNFLENS